MRQLHVLGVSEDGTTLLLGTTKNAVKPTHRIPVDDRLVRATRGQLVVNGDRAESALTPKEYQARMRAGASPEEVAKAAGVPVARVLPYFAPVEAERDRIVDQARAAVMHRHRGPDSVRPLGEAVDAHLAEVAGVKDDSVVWTARRRGDGAWIVRLSYAARGGRRKAEWLWQPAGRELSPLDAAATRLAADPAVGSPKRRTTRTAAAKKATAKKPAARKPAAKKAPAKKAAAKKATRTAPTREAAVKKAAPARAVVKKAAPAPARAAKKAAPAKRPVTKAAPPATRKAAAPAPVPVTRKRATPKAPVRKRATRPAAVEPTPAPVVQPMVEEPTYQLVREPVVELVPVPTETEPEPAPAAPAAARSVPPAPPRKPGQRVPLPSWSEVLLGVSGNHDGDAPEGGNGGRRAG